MTNFNKLDKIVIDYCNINDHINKHGVIVKVIDVSDNIDKYGTTGFYKVKVGKTTIPNYANDNCLKKLQ